MYHVIRNLVKRLISHQNSKEKETVTAIQRLPKEVPTQKFPPIEVSATIEDYHQRRKGENLILKAKQHEKKEKHV